MRKSMKRFIIKGSNSTPTPYLPLFSFLRNLRLKLSIFCFFSNYSFNYKLIESSQIIFQLKIKKSQIKSWQSWNTSVRGEIVWKTEIFHLLMIATIEFQVFRGLFLIFVVKRVFTENGGAFWFFLQIATENQAENQKKLPRPHQKRY